MDKAFFTIELKGKDIKNRFNRSAVYDHLGNMGGTDAGTTVDFSSYWIHRDNIFAIPVIVG